MRSRKYYIVGTGPGDPGLLTNQAMKAIAESDLILTDSLVPDEIIESFCAGKRVIHVGHRASRDHSGIIERISVVLDSTEFTIASHLKEGDPSIFSHLYEEVQMIRERHIEYEIIPGVSSAIAVPEVAGLVLTGRSRSESFVVVSARDASGAFNEAEIRSALNSSGSVVIMMGSRYLGKIRDLLIDLRYEWPVAVIENGTRPDQKVTVYRDASHIDTDEAMMPAIIVTGQMIILEEVERYENGVRN